MAGKIWAPGPGNDHIDQVEKMSFLSQDMDSFPAWRIIPGLESSWPFGRGPTTRSSGHVLTVVINHFLSPIYKPFIPFRRGPTTQTTSKSRDDHPTVGNFPSWWRCVEGMLVVSDLWRPCSPQMVVNKVRGNGTPAISGKPR